MKHLKDDVIQDFHDKWSIRETCDSVTLESTHPLYEDLLGYPPDVQLLHTYECKDNEVAYFKVDVNLIKNLPLLNMTSAAPLSVVLSLLSQRKEGKRGRSVSHV